MTLSNEEVARCIRGAFKGVILGEGVGLLEGQALDDRETELIQAAARAKDEKQDWSAIPLEHLYQCTTSLSFFDAEGMRFHLPAFLLADLLNPSAIRNLVFHLAHLDDYGRSQFTMLTAEQRAAIRDYLLFVREHPNYTFEREAITASLTSYWKG